MNLTFPCRFKCTMPFMKPNSPWLLTIQTACLKNWANLKVSDNFQEKRGMEFQNNKQYTYDSATTGISGLLICSYWYSALT